ncbi:MAG: radical SAM protein [Myxococcota bacterium]
MTDRPFVDAWRRRTSAAFVLGENSTAGRAVRVTFPGGPLDVYANANFSVYSAQPCNARCGFCVEELRPASRGGALAAQRVTEPDDERWFAALERALDTVRAVDPSVSVTGGEPSRDPRLPRLLRALAARGARKRTVTTNGSGLLDVREGRRLVDWIADTGVTHLNVSIAHPDPDVNARLMRYRSAPRDVAAVVRGAGDTRVRLSCVLTTEGVADLDGVVAYVRWARAAGVDNVIFRQLMKADADTAADDPVVVWSDTHRVRLEPLLDAISADARFSFRRQIVGYYYYVEVWRFEDVDVVFEEADLARLERVKRTSDVVHELVFHPDGALCGTWQPWDGVLLPGTAPARPDVSAPAAPRP